MMLDVQELSATAYDNTGDLPWAWLGHVTTWDARYYAYKYGVYHLGHEGIKIMIRTPRKEVIYDGDPWWLHG